MIVKKEIKGKGFDKLPMVAMMAPQMMDFILQMKSLGFSANAIKVILILSANLKEQQNILRQKDKKRQLDLFDNEWMLVENNASYSVQFNFKFADFLPKGNKNYKQVKDGLDELQEFNHTLSFSKFDEAQGKMRHFKLKSALIQSYIMEEGNGFKMIINNFWYRALVNVSESFNSYFKGIVFDLNFNSTILYFYLKFLPYVKAKEYHELKEKIGLSAKEIKGTQIKFENFVKLFNLDYKYESDIRRKLLEPIRNELNKFSDISFNYKIEDGKIYIITYEMSSLAVANKVIDVEENKIRNAINYKVKKYDMSKTDATFLIEVYIKYTYNVVLKATNKNKHLRGLTGTEYVSKFQELIEHYIKVNGISLEKISYENMKEMRTTLRKGFYN